MTVKDELHQLVDALDDAHAAEALDYLRWLALNGSSEDLGDESTEVREGEPFTMDDALWSIVGIGRSTEPTDVAKYKDDYVADAIDPTNS